MKPEFTTQNETFKEVNCIFAGNDSVCMTLRNIVIKTIEKHATQKKNVSMEVLVALKLGKPTLIGAKKVL